MPVFRRVPLWFAEHQRRSFGKAWRPLQRYRVHRRRPANVLGFRQTCAGQQ